MAKQKTIPELETEKAENERKLSQLQHKKQQIENRITYYEKGLRKPLTPFVHWAHGEKNMSVWVAAAGIVNVGVCTHSSGNELRGTVRTDKPYLFLSG